MLIKDYIILYLLSVLILLSCVRANTYLSVGSVCVFFRIDKPKALSLLLHTADISHPAKNWDLHHRWTTSLLEEFFRQVRHSFVLRRVQRVFAFVCMCEKSKAQQEKSHLLLCILILSLFLFSSDCPFIQSHVSLRQDYHRPQKWERVIPACLHLNINLWK